MEIRKRIYVSACIFLAMFFIPLLGVSRYAVFETREIVKNPKNHYSMPEPALRGRIFDRCGRLLAYSSGCKRVFPLREAAGPLMGYCSPVYGEAGLEKYLSDRLRGYPVPRSPFAAYKILKKGSRCGDDIELTIDSDIQKTAYEALGGYKGAAAVISTKDGEILALASAPSYDPNDEQLQEDWSMISSDSESARLLNRSTQGLYPPGSTFKVLIMAAALEEKLTYPEETFYCLGKDLIVNFILNCSSQHDRINLREALGYSCNVAFGRLGVRLGMDGIRRWMQAFFMDSELEEVPGALKAVLPKADTPSAPAETAIGQGDMLLSPLHMARTACIIANKGFDIEPGLIKSQACGKEIVWEHSIKKTKIISEKNAAAVGEAMKFTVEQGTGTAAYIPGVPVAAKTGSAENPHGKVHAWFIGYAPADNPEIAVAVILENAGGGGRYAAPAAKKIIEEALKKYGRNAENP